MIKKPRVALVHDWLTNQGGGERVLLALHEAYPDAPIYTSVYEPSKMQDFSGIDIRTSFLQNWPLARTKHQLYPLLRTVAFESFDFSEYDIVISSCSAESKGIITRPDTLHISYLHTPTRYYWSDYDQYLLEPGFGWLNPLVRLVMPPLVRSMRRWDLAASARVDKYVANSAFVAERISTYYHRDSTVIHPPIRADRFAVSDKPGRGYLVAGRLIPYKRADLAVEACRDLDLPLTVAGRGGELQRLRKLAGPKTTFLDNVSDTEMAKLFAEHKAMIFGAEEDFGLTPLESMAAGRPVVAYGSGGALETVAEGKTGTFFQEQTVASLSEALKRFENMEWDTEAIRKYALDFDESVFIEKIRTYVETEYRRMKR